jgi:hypothetical protein
MRQGLGYRARDDMKADDVLRRIHGGLYMLMSLRTTVRTLEQEKLIMSGLCLDTLIRQINDV